MFKAFGFKEKYRWLDRDAFTKVRHPRVVAADTLEIVLETKTSYHLILTPVVMEWKSCNYSSK